MPVAGAIVDLDGTVYRGGDLLPDVADGIDALRKRGMPTMFFSNNPTRTGAEYLDHLADLGLSVDDAMAGSAADVTVAYLEQHHPDAHVAVVGSGGLRSALTDAGIATTEDFARADVLLASWTEDFDYEDMRTVANDVGPETTFLGTDPDRRVPSADGTVVPGSGSIINALAGVLEREPDRVLGKPSAAARRFALDRLGTDPSETLVVGDNLGTDIAMGAEVGMTTVVVLTGNTTETDVAGADVRPDYVVASLAELEGVLSEIAGSTP